MQIIVIHLKELKLSGSNLTKLISEYINWQACNSVNGYITNDYQNKISYLSTRLAIDKNVSLLLNQAAIRSLSCEVVPGKEGQIYFGDSIRGHVLSHTFFLKDNQARGFHRWYSIIVFMRDKHFLLNSWSFFLKHIKKMIYELQEMAAQVYSSEQNKGSQRDFRLANRDPVELNSRSLMKLTASKAVFAKIHLWFSWLLSVGAKRLEEHLPTRELECNIEEIQDIDNFFIVEVKDEYSKYNTEEIITDIRSLRNILGSLKFNSLIYSALVGHQIVIRGPKNIVRHIINLLRFFIPKKKIQCLEYEDSYQPPEICKIIGLSLYAAAPKPTFNILRLDILPRTKKGCVNSTNSSVDLYDYELLLKTGYDVPLKWPTLLIKTDKALSDDTLKDKVVFLNINSLIEEWINLTDVIMKAKKGRKNSDLAGLFQCLGAQEQDHQLIEFWTS